MTEARTPLAQEALSTYNEIQLCREMGWSQRDLYEADDDFVYYASQALRWDAQKQKADMEEADRRNGAGGRSLPRNPDEPQRIPLRPPPGVPERIEVPDDTPWDGPQLGPGVLSWER